MDHKIRLTVNGYEPRGNNLNQARFFDTVEFIKLGILIFESGFQMVILQKKRPTHSSACAYIRSINRHDHKKMLIVLQTIEARLVSGKVCGRLADWIPPDVGFFSVHDCVALPDVYQAAAHDAFADVSHQLEFPLRVETK